MCGLFGFLRYGKTLPRLFGTDELAEALAVASATRGTDATGIAYNMDGKLHIDKSPTSAYKFKMDFPDNTRALMGHTRLSTQGSEKKNYNNHPFRGRAGYDIFALAHNGTIWNDRFLQRDEKLPSTKVETDSYVAVQLLEKYGKLTMSTVKKMGETVSGSFTFSILDPLDGMYFVRGDNPLAIVHFPAMGIYVYASTATILLEALTQWYESRTLLLDALRGEKLQAEMYMPKEGEILYIGPGGKIKCETFVPDSGYYYGYGKDDYSWSGTPKRTGTGSVHRFSADSRGTGWSMYDETTGDWVEGRSPYKGGTDGDLDEDEADLDENREYLRLYNLASAKGLVVPYLEIKGLIVDWGLTPQDVEDAIEEDYIFDFLEEYKEFAEETRDSTKDEIKS